MFYRSTPRFQTVPDHRVRIITELSSPEDFPDLKLASYPTNGGTLAHA